MSNRKLSNCQSTPPFRLLFATSVLDAERSEIERKTRRGPTRQGLPAVAARGSDHRGTVCLSTPHGVFAIAARCVLLFHASRPPPKSIKNGPFPREKGPFPVLRRRAQKNIVHILSGLHILATFQESCRGVRGLHFRGILRGRAEVRM